MDTGSITPPERFVQGFIDLDGTAFDLSQKTLDRHPHRSRPAETGHVTEDVRGIQTLVVNLGTQKVNQLDRDFMQDPFGQFILLQESDVTLQRPHREIMHHRLQMQGVMDIHAEAIVTRLAAQHEVSRKFVYQQMERATTAIDRVFQEPRSQEGKVLFQLPVTRDWLEQLVLSLTLICHSSFRGAMELSTRLAQTPRASSIVENLNSRLRNYFFLRRQIGHGYLHLLRFFLNHRRFLRNDRPERVGKGPAELLTGERHPHWLEMLGYTRFHRN